MKTDYVNELENRAGLKVKDSYLEKFPDTKAQIEYSDKLLAYFLLGFIFSILIIYIYWNNRDIFVDENSALFYSIGTFLFLLILTITALHSYERDPKNIFFTYLCIEILFLAWAFSLFHTLVNEFLSGIFLISLFCVLLWFIYSCAKLDKLTLLPSIYLMIWFIFISILNYQIYQRFIRSFMRD